MIDDIFHTNEHITFRFKGGRDYIHGTDIYAAIENSLISTQDARMPDSISQFRLAIRKPSSHSCDISIVSNDSLGKKPDNAVVDFQFNHRGRSFRGWLSETGSSISEHYEFAENKVIAGCVVSGDRVVLNPCLSCTTIENLVAATKHLHTTRFPEAEGKWFFSRIDLPHLLPTLSNQNLAISLKQCVGKRLTRSDIQIDGQPHGSVYFSLVSV
jgi:hypothetical protein